MGLVVCGALFSTRADLLITNVVVSTGAVVLSGSGGENDGTYRVLSTTGVTAAVTNWAVIATNQFDSTGQFVSTNPVSPAVSAGYFSVETVAGDGLPDFDAIVGYGAGTTGGAGGPIQTVTTAAAFESAAESTGPRIIRVDGSLSVGIVNVKSGKTIVGVDGNAAIIGNLMIDSQTNIIIRNLNISYFPGSDGITIQDFSRNIWIDHCTFGNCGDGQLDITHGSDFITVSWCVFAYNPSTQTSHRFSNLVGHDENNGAQDAGRLHITYHHNRWGGFVVERMPRVRFGRIHSFNNYFFSPGNTYCIRVSLQSEVLSEASYFRGVDTPYTKITELGQTGLIKTVNDIWDHCNEVFPYNDNVFTPPYAYSADPAADVPNLLNTWAGAGKITP